VSARRGARPTVRGLRAGYAATSTGLLLLALLVGCTEGGSTPPEPPATTRAAGPTPAVELTFGVFGSRAEVAGYDDMVNEFNAISDDTQVSVVSWRDHDEAFAAMSSGEPLPDVFLISRRDLATLQEAQQLRPVDELLDARGVDFGDGYARDALRAFSLDDRLQCMPYGISPMVVYYNTELIEFARMRARELPAPGSDSAEELPTRWTFEQFAAAAEFATRPRRNTRGLWVEPSLLGLAPFIVSGDGRLFDNDTEPTSLAFSSEETRGALETTLELLRNAQLTLTPEQLEERSALEWFERGKLGMIAGFRDLVPRLRQVQGLEFDVMPIPVIESSGTIGDINGLCLSADSEHAARAADFLAHAVSEPSVTAVARAGYLVPANAAVAASDDFLQPGRLPANSQVFNTSVRDIYMTPLIDSWADLENAVAPEIEELITIPVLEPETIEEITTMIDEESRLILAPETASPSPSE
jgi:multiple sugar transport system substrate-binding protein